MKKQFHQNLKLVTNLIIYLILLLLCIFLLPKVCVFFMPFIVGWIISCIANPLVIFLDKKLKIRRKAGTVVVIILVIAAVSGIGYLAVSVLIKQLAAFISEIPEIWQSMENDFTHVGNMLGHIFPDMSPKWTQTLNSVGNLVGEGLTSFAGSIQTTSLDGVGSMVGNIASVAISVIMSMLSSYFFIADREYVTHVVKTYIPERLREKYGIFYGSLKQAVGGYFKAQFRIEIWMYLLILLGLSILQVHYAILLALLIAMLDFLPFFGTGAVFWPWAIFKLLGGNYVQAIGFIVIWGVGQLVRQLIQPKIMGDSIGLEPVPTLFLLYIGYRVGGVVGMILAVPIGIIIINMNEAGLFDTPKQSVRLLMKNINEYRKLTEEDLAGLEEESTKENPLIRK